MENGRVFAFIYTERLVTNMQQILSYVPIALLAIVALILVINIVKALIRGLKKTVGTLIAIVFSAIVAMIVTMIVCKPDSALMDWLVNMLKDTYRFLRHVYCNHNMTSSQDILHH